MASRSAHAVTTNGNRPRVTEADRLPFGRLVRRYRMSANLTQARLAELSEIDPSYVAMIEAGRTSPDGRRDVRPTRDIVLRIAQALAAPAYEMLAAADRLEVGDRRRGKPMPSFAEVVSEDWRLTDDARRVLLDLYKLLTKG